jgi:NIMA (never in mitosis gene a)-related kinase 1/4/5
VRKSDSSVYAMKKVKMQKLSSKEKENALNEVRILASIQHPNVIGYKEAFFEDATNSLCIVMENADGGDVLKLISEKKRKNEKLGEKTIWHYFIQVVRGLKALHDLKICHRDIKCANIFLTKSGVAKLGDLNVSKVAKRGMLRTQTGTPYYACPEVWKDMPYDHRSDIWSLGCVLYEMICQVPPFRATTMKGLYTKVISGKYDPIPNQYSSDLKTVLKCCLQVRASERSDCGQLLKMPGLLQHVADISNS